VLLTARDARDRIDHEVRLLRLAGAERRMVRSLQALLASMDEGVALLDADGDLVLANDAMTALTGGPVADRAGLEAGLRTPLVDGEVQQPDDGRWLRITVRNEDDARLVIVRDITEERAAEAAHEAFIGVLSHELRTPVTTILGIAHLLGRSSRATDPDRRDLAEDLQAEAGRLDDLVEDLLILSRAQSGSVAFEPEPVLVQHAIRTALTAESARYPMVTFRSDIAAGLPPVSGDATYVDQVLRNLIGNAGKYTVGNGNEVLVTAAVAGDEVEVAVLDRGPGFAPEDADRLFDLYFRSSTTARIKAGSGIGLYVARTLVQAMGGRIQARLRTPRGSAFTFWLPILQVDEAEVLR
jgi:signal transduction histidine kinase